MSTVEVRRTTGSAAEGAPVRMLVAFVRLSRLRFLLESFLLVVTGTSVGIFLGFSFSLSGYLTAQGFAWGTHLTVHYCNEYFDLEADTAQLAPTAWTGGSRVLATGQLRPVVSLAAAFVSLFLVLALVVVLPDVPTRMVALAAVALAWFYTAPPLRLNYRGLGEVTTAVVVSLLFPVLAGRLQVGSFPLLSWAVVGPVGLLMTARMTVMNFVDGPADLSVGKRTLPNLLGSRRAAVLFAVLQVGGYGAVLVLTVFGVLPVAVGVAVLLTAVIGGWLAGRLFRDPPDQQAVDQANRTAMWATTQVHAVGVAVTVGLLVAAGLAHRAGLGDGAVLIALYLVFFVARRVPWRRVSAKWTGRRKR